MRLPTGVRVVLGAIAIAALFVGVMMWSGPAEFSGAQVGEFVECDSGVCRVIDVDASLFEGDVDFSDMPRTVLFQGTEAEVSEWTREKHVEATRPIAISWLAGAVVLGGLALLSGRRTPSQDDTTPAA